MKKLKELWFAFVGLGHGWIPNEQLKLSVDPPMIYWVRDGSEHCMFCGKVKKGQ